MATYWPKQPTARQNINNSITITTGSNGTSLASNAFGPFSVGIRVTTQVAGFFRVDGAGSAATVADMYLPANVEAEYFACGPGGFAYFLTTSTSTGVCSVTEVC
jgi:hypothetical protein